MTGNKTDAGDLFSLPDSICARNSFSISSIFPIILHYRPAGVYFIFRRNHWKKITIGINECLGQIGLAVRILRYSHSLGNGEMDYPTPIPGL
jgi:hypothetical protein